jgi:hypothetical protein
MIAAKGGWVVAIRPPATNIVLHTFSLACVYAGTGLMRILLLLSILAAGVSAQGFTDPPPIVQLVRKPGARIPASRSYASAGAAVNVIGMAAITGLPETWLLEAHDSFASVEYLDRALSSLPPAAAAGDPSDPLQDDVLAPSRTMIAIYRPGWSYRPTDAIRAFPKARYFQLAVYRIRLGAEADFGELVRLRRATSDSVNLDRPELAYQVLSGAPAGTFIFMTPLPTLAAMDEATAPLPVYAEPVAAARGKDGPKIAYDSEISRERLLFRVDPRISYVSDAFAESDPGFWRGKGNTQ